MDFAAFSLAGAPRFFLKVSGPYLSRRFMSASRKPAARVRPGNLIFLTGSLSTVRSETDRRRATSARRIMRGTVSAGCVGGVSAAPPVRQMASTRARSAGVSVGSVFSPDRNKSMVVDNIFALFRLGAYRGSKKGELVNFGNVSTPGFPCLRGFYAVNPCQI